MIKYSKAILGNSDLTSAQAFVYLTNNLNLFFLISATGEDIFTKIRQVGGELEIKFFELEGDISKRILECFEFIKHDLGACENLSILLAASQEDILYLQKEGNHQAYLLRDGEITSLFPAMEAENKLSQLISGYIKKGDKLIFLTESLKKVIDESSLKKLSLASVDEFEDEVDAYSLNFKVPEPVSALLIDYHSDELENPQELKRERLENNFSQGGINFSLPKIKIPNFNFFNDKKIRIGAAFAAAFILLLGGGIFIKNQFFSNSKTSQTSSEIENSEKKEGLPAGRQGLKSYQVSNFENFLSLNLIKEGFSASKLSFSLGKLLILDETKKTLVYLDLTNKSPKILAGEDKLGNAKFASLNGDFAFIYSEDKGILRIDIQDPTPKVVIKTDSEWGKITDIFGFAGNIYLLDSLNNQIWKYVPIPSGYSNKFSYLKEVKINLLESKKMQIDSSIWVLKTHSTSSGQAVPEIIKFTQGVKDSFSIGGLDSPIKDLNSFFVSENGDFVYLLDSSNQRVVVVRKNGAYEAQYLGDKFKTASDLAVDEAEKKIYLLEGSTIYQVELR